MTFNPLRLLLALSGCLIALSGFSDVTNGAPVKPIPPGLRLDPLPPAEVLVPVPDTRPPDSPAAIPPVRQPAVVVEPASPPLPDESYDDEYVLPDWMERTSDLVHEHLRIGVRYRNTTLSDDSRTTENSYLGSITKLKPLQDYDLITWLTFEWLANPYAAIRFTWEQVRAETSTTSYDNHTDGDIDLIGPALALMLRLPNQTRFTPSGGIGYTWLSSTFEHNPVWYNGFGGVNKEADYDAWVAAGSPPWPNHGYRREIMLDDTTGLLLIGALEYRITDHLDLNVFIQHMEVQEVGVTYTLSFGGNPFETTQAEFPMSNTSLGIGLRWTF